MDNVEDGDSNQQPSNEDDNGNLDDYKEKIFSTKEFKNLLQSDILEIDPSFEYDIEEIYLSEKEYLVISKNGESLGDTFSNFDGHCDFADLVAAAAFCTANRRVKILRLEFSQVYSQRVQDVINACFKDYLTEKDYTVTKCGNDLELIIANPFYSPHVKVDFNGKDIFDPKYLGLKTN